MLTSMTGFGRAEIPLSLGGRAVVEVHSLNHKFLEVECRLPEGFQGVEEPIRSLVGARFRRGRVKVSVALKPERLSSPVVFQADLAQRYVAQLKAVQKKLKIPGAVDLGLVLNLPQVMTAPRQEDLSVRGWPRLRAGVVRALDRAARMRRQEGGRLEKGLRRFLRLLESSRRAVNRRLPLVQARMEEKFSRRIQAMVPAVEPRAAAAEAAQMVQASDVSEEMERLASHLAALHQLMGASSESPGRTIDFLAQELHREVNTLGAKVRDVQVVRQVVAMKGHIEKLREQAANVE